MRGRLSHVRTHVRGGVLDGQHDDGDDHLDPNGRQDAQRARSDQLVRILKRFLNYDGSNRSNVLPFTSFEGLLRLRALTIFSMASATKGLRTSLAIFDI